MRRCGRGRSGCSGASRCRESPARRAARRASAPDPRCRRSIRPRRSRRPRPRAAPRQSRRRRRARGRGKSTSRRRARPAPPASVRWRRRSGSPAAACPAGSSSLPVTTSRTRGCRTHVDVAHADRAEDADDPAAAARGPARAAVVPRTMSSPAGRHSCRATPRRARAIACSRAPVSASTEFGRQHGVGAARHRRAGHDAHRLARRDTVPSNGTAGHRVADDGQRQPAVGARAVGARGHHRVAVHRRAIEARHVHVADDRRRQHAARRLGKRHVLGGERPQLRVEPRQRRGDGVPPREAAHADVRRLRLRASGSSGSWLVRSFAHVQAASMRRQPPGLKPEQA